MTRTVDVEIVFHAIWSAGRLHVWGEKHLEADVDGSPQSERYIDHEGLRSRVGDVWDSLLVSGAESASLLLRLPHRDGQPLPSREGPVHGGCPEPESVKMVLQPFRLPTLAFDPADAVDLLTASASLASPEASSGASLRFWARMAELVLELLGKQRFIPAVHRTAEQQYHGYWRVVVDDRRTLDRLGDLILSMPPVCRSMEATEVPVQASQLVENFLWRTADALIRRSLEGDELAHALHGQPDDSWSPEMRWLRSLVGEDTRIHGEPETCAKIFQVVGEWLGKLEPSESKLPYRLCFRLHSPPASDSSPANHTLQPVQMSSGPISDAAGVDDEGHPSPDGWRLTLHLQDTRDSKVVVDAGNLRKMPSNAPVILNHPFHGAEDNLRTEIDRAAKHFPPLASCAESDTPFECRLTAAEAYSFLREATPLLERDGFGVWLPRWCRGDRPRLRMHLELRPLEPLASDVASDEAFLSLESLVAYDWRVALGDQTMSLEDLRELAASNAPLASVKGQWAVVQAAELRGALEFLDQNPGGQMSVSSALREYYSADDHKTGLPVSGLRAYGWIDRFLNTSEVEHQVEPLPPPVAFQGTLRPYQLKGLQWLRFLTKHGLGACLADDMGLGKTIQLIALWLSERESGPSPGPTLLVVPMSLVGNWQREIAKFSPSLRVMVHHGLERLTGQAFLDEVAKHDVVISTYGLTHRDYDHLAAVDWHRIALDEAQNIKNPAAKQAVAVRALRAHHRVALTGTPVENRLSELWSIIDFLNPAYLGTAGDFRRRYAVPIERNHDMDRAQRLRHLIRPFVLRRLKKDPNIVPDLPDKMEAKVFCNLTAEQAALYQATVDRMLGQVDSAGGIQRRGMILAVLVKLKQVCDHPALLLADGSPIPHRSGKCNRLTEMLEEVVAEGHCALVFTQFRTMGHLLQKHLQESLSRTVLFLHGGTSQKNRDAMVERFQNETEDTPVFILSLKAGGFGLNLTAANHVFHFDRWWNPAVENQATDRAHRIGQKRQVQVHKFVCVGTIEERIDASIEQKRDLAENIVGSGQEWVTELSTKALRELFTLSREAVSED